MAKTAPERRSEKKDEKTPTLASVPPPNAEKPSLWRALTPSILLDSTPAEWLFKMPATKRHTLLLIAFAAIIFFPYLGAVGFWDPWEVHYGEVARSMIVRQDFIHPYWESAYFFSKPVFPLWMSALGMLIAGVNDPARGTALYTEWGVRSVYASLAIVGVVMVYQVTARTISRRAGIWASVILATSPIYFMLARQAVPDMPFVVLVTSATACLMIAIFEKEEVQDGYLYAFYAICGLAVLAKGLLGFVLPGLAMLVYCIFSGDWRILGRLRLATGALVTLAVCGPWIGTMSFFPGKDDESNSFAFRFFIHDHFKRLGYDPTRGEFIAGVHTTTPMGYNVTFTYYIEQLGFGLFPWVALVPGMIANFLAVPRLTLAKTRKQKAKLFVVCWLVVTYTLFSFAATKFHHYDFPMVPPLAILFGLFMEDVLEDGVSKHAIALFAGLVLFGMVGQNLAMDPKHLTDMYVYNYDRPYPAHETNPTEAFAIMMALMPLAALLGVPEPRRWIAAPNGAFMAAAIARAKASGKKIRAVFLAIIRGPVMAWEWLVKLLGVKKPVMEEPEDRLYVMGALTIMAFCFAVYTSSYHWRKLSHHWTQRDLFWEYHNESRPDEPIGAYQMNWRGETFYSRNMVRQLKEPQELKDFVAAPGGRYWLLVEQARLAGMKSTIGPGYDVKIIDKSNNKFVLAVVSRDK